ncbi:MAG: RHS repeat-associated core domain-containing protein, partial [Candidatus Bipolaricaulis sp.]|nr:RHS repeat-associated core domain-containing protein [Candidatus Bipolaricaulis sp.]
LTIDNEIPVTTTEIVRYQYSNHLGSASLELDENALIISYEEYHPFGTTSYHSGNNETEVKRKRYRYVGKERDDETGLYNYGFRMYAPWLGRFISVDPLQFEYPQLTPFNYAGNKPITHIDIDGLQGTGDKKLGIDPNRNKNKTIYSDYYFPKGTTTSDLGGRKPLTIDEASEAFHAVKRGIMQAYDIKEKDGGGYEFNRTNWVSKNADPEKIGKPEPGNKNYEDYKLNLYEARDKANTLIKKSIFFQSAGFEQTQNSKPLNSNRTDDDGLIIGNWFPVAIVVTGDASGGTGLTASGEAGFIYVLQGPDTGKIALLSDAGVGRGHNNPSVNAKLGFMFWTGDVKKFKLDAAGGYRTEVNAGISAFMELGISCSIGRYDSESKGRTIVQSLSVGGSLTPTIGEGDVNYGRTFISRFK